MDHMVTARQQQAGARGPVDAVAIIPARGGSKSIPRKNVRPFAGPPLLAWSIAAARESASCHRILVSTDDEAIRDLAISLGAEAPFLRPAALAQDDTPDFPVIQHALDWLARECGEHPSLVVQLRPTSPVRPQGMVDAAIDRLRASADADSLRAVTPAGQNPYKMWCLDGALLAPLLGHEGPEPYNMPRQRLPATFWQTGHIDVIRRATIERGTLTGTRIAPLLTDPRFAVDLDTPDQWEQAEWVAHRYRAEIVSPRPGRERLRRIGLVALDFDGVLTDNRVLVRGDGEESVLCDRGDGLGLAALRDRGLPIVVLSTEEHPVVGARCRKLRLPFRQGLADKASALRAVAAEYGVPLDDVLYVGNDVNDRDCLRLAGLAVVPRDAHPAVLADAGWILSHAGGRGAVRELCDTLLEVHAP
jgi:N-acylneuraminate cytidylyltransferase